MEVLIYLVVCIPCLILLIYITGLLLPKTRVVTRSSTFAASPKTLYTIVTDNTDWKYRSSLKDLVIVEQNGDNEVWEEYPHKGAIIRFTTKEKVPYSFYSFDMDCKMFSGYWTATFDATNGGGTLFTATEYISIKSPIIKTLSYLFFDIGKLMNDYQNDLRIKVETDSKK